MANTTNPEPAQWLEGISLNFKAGTVTPVEAQTIIERLVGPSTVEKSPPIGRGYTMLLSSGGVPTQLLPFDLARHTARISASLTDVFIGEYDQLSGSGLGAIVPIGGGSIEVTSTNEIYVSYKPSAGTTGDPVYVSVWVEKWAE